MYICVADIDECAVPALADKCVANAECCNLPAEYICKCKPGFEGDGLVECRGTLYITYSTSHGVGILIKFIGCLHFTDNKIKQHSHCNLNLYCKYSTYYPTVHSFILLILCNIHVYELYMTSISVRAYMFNHCTMFIWVLFSCSQSRDIYILLTPNSWLF